MSSELKPPTPPLTLHRGFPIPTTHVWSPFVTKLEFRLRHSSLPYTSTAGSPRSAPLGKLPYITIPSPFPTLAPRTLGDSTLIIKTLVVEGSLKDLNSRLDRVEKCRDLAIRALLEEKLYFYQTYERWHLNYSTMRSGVLYALPYPAQLVVGYLVYRQTARTLDGQGTMRFTYSEISDFRKEIWEGVNALLCESLRLKKNVEDGKQNDGGPFWVLGGNEATECDATVFGFVVSALVCDAGPDTRKVVKGFPVVVEYARRIQERYFPDYEMWKE